LLYIYDNLMNYPQQVTKAKQTGDKPTNIALLYR